MERWAGTVTPLPSSREALPRDSVSVQLWQADCKRCGQGKQNQLRMNAYQKMMIDVPSVYGLLQSNGGGGMEVNSLQVRVQSFGCCLHLGFVFYFLSMDLC